jgi:hypothetical protein
MCSRLVRGCGRRGGTWLDSIIEYQASPIKNVSFQSTYRDQIIQDLTSIKNPNRKPRISPDIPGRNNDV